MVRVPEGPLEVLPIQRASAAGIYTQTTDVEGEINGLPTYDRRARKLKPEELRGIARMLEE